MTRATLPITLCGFGLVLLATLFRDHWVRWSAVESSIHQEFPEVQQLSTEELAQWLADPERPTPLLLDVRRAEEYQVSHLEGAWQVDPDLEGSELRAALPAEIGSETPIVAYCSVGYRSSRLARRLEAEGFGDVANLEGSIFRWANEGRPLVTTSAEGEPIATRSVHPYDRTWGRLLDRERWAWEP